MKADGDVGCKRQRTEAVGHPRRELPAGEREHGTVEVCHETELVRELRRSKRVTRGCGATEVTTVAAVTGIERKQTLQVLTCVCFNQGGTAELPLRP